MTNWQPASPALWQGRDDRAESPTALRLFQTITLSPAFSPEMYSEQIALLGFACDEGVKRNQGRTGAAGAPDALRKALANLASHDGHQRLVDLGNIVAQAPDLEGAQQALRKAVQRCQQENMRTLVLGEGTKPRLRMALACWMRSRRQKWASSISTRISICVMPTRPHPVRRFASWRTFAMNSSADFTMPVSASVGRQIPRRCGMKRSGSVSPWWKICTVIRHRPSWRSLPLAWMSSI